MLRQVAALAAALEGEPTGLVLIRPVPELVWRPLPESMGLPVLGQVASGLQPEQVAEVLSAGRALVQVPVSW